MNRRFCPTVLSLSVALAVTALKAPAFAQDPLEGPGSSDAPATTDAPKDAKPSEEPKEKASPEPAEGGVKPPEKEPAVRAEKPPASSSALPAGEKPTVSEEAPKSWFYREPLRLKVGNRLAITWYGVVQADAIYDTTRSYGDTIGSSLVARSDTYEGTVGRFQMSARATRFGMAVDAAEIAGNTPKAVIEADFSGDQPTNAVGASERSYYDSPSLRLRHAYLSLDNAYLDLLIGQTDDVFGWQNTPSSVFRHTQIRLSTSFLESSPIGVDLAAAAVRPAQRDSRMPDAQAGIRLTANRWKGIYARDGIPHARKLSVGVSGVTRQFDVDAFTPPPTQTSNKVVGWGVSFDAVIPVIPAKDDYDRSNALTFAGSFVTGTGIGDLMRVDGGAEFPPLPNPARASPPPEYEPNVDPGLVSFDRLGVLNTIDWQGFRVDGQYYFPGGRVRLAGIYYQAYSRNMDDLYPQGGVEIDLITHIADRMQYAEGNLYWDVTPEVRFGVAGIYTKVRYLDKEEPHNIRGKFTANYFF